MNTYNASMHIGIYFLGPVRKLTVASHAIQHCFLINNIFILLEPLLENTFSFQFEDVHKHATHNKGKSLIMQWERACPRINVCVFSRYACLQKIMKEVWSNWVLLLYMKVTLDSFWNPPINRITYLINVYYSVCKFIFICFLPIPAIIMYLEKIRFNKKVAQNSTKFLQRSCIFDLNSFK